MEDERTLLLEDELLIVRHSGEIPEIALRSTLYYRCEDPEGPQLILSDEELVALQDAALKRSREIVLRDLDPSNRDLTLYRGVRRSIYNWHRHQAFCKRIKRSGKNFHGVVGKALLAFLKQEKEDVVSGDRVSCVNCTADELQYFISVLQCDPDELPSGWQSLCKCRI